MEEKQIKLLSEDGEDEGYPGYGRKVSLNTVNKVAKSICTITIKENKEKNILNNSGTGFFMIIKFEERKLKCLITNYHIISQNIVDFKEYIMIQIEKENKKIEIQLDSNKRFIKCFKVPLDCTLIEIKDSDQIIDDVFFLSYDLNYLAGYNDYNESDILILQHPLGEETQLGIGKIMKILNFEFEHSIETDNGSSGSPVILIGNLKVVGIHKQRNKKNDNGIGTFIGEIFKELEKEKNNLKIENNKESSINNLLREKNDINNNYIIQNKNDNISTANLIEKKEDGDNNIMKNDIGLKNNFCSGGFKKMRELSFRERDILLDKGLKDYRIKGKL